LRQARIQLVGGQIHRRHGPRFGPAAIERIGIGQILAQLFIGLAAVHGLGQNIDTLRLIPGQRQRQP
jgi:hypothetical protein